MDASKLKKEFPELMDIKQSYEENVFKRFAANGGKPIVDRSKGIAIPPKISVTPEVVAPPAVSSTGENRYLVFGRTGWIGGILGQLLEAEGADWQFATCRLQEREKVRPAFLFSNLRYRFALFVFVRWVFCGASLDEKDV
eukprot:1872857-Pyramimonas_sp.AAC.1